MRAICSLLSETEWFVVYERSCLFTKIFSSRFNIRRTDGSCVYWQNRIDSENKLHVTVPISGEPQTTSSRKAMALRMKVFYEPVQKRFLFLNENARRVVKVLICNKSWTCQPTITLNFSDTSRDREETERGETFSGSGNRSDVVYFHLMSGVRRLHHRSCEQRYMIQHGHVQCLQQIKSLAR